MRRTKVGFLFCGPPRGRGPDVRIPRITTLTGLLTVFLLSLLALAPAQAQDCISEITVICCSSGTQPPPGYTKINIDLNQGAGGDYLYLCYRKGVGAPITGLAVTIDGGAPPTDAVYTRINVDLNRNAGGDYIWLWYTRDPACTVIRNVHIQPNQGAWPDGYVRIPVDLNRNAGGAYIYLCYEEY